MDQLINKTEYALLKIQTTSSQVHGQPSNPAVKFTKALLPGTVHVISLK
jgi:hypothetical protein